MAISELYTPPLTNIIKERLVQKCLPQTFSGGMMVYGGVKNTQLPSLPVVIQLIKICGLPVERYFNPELMREESAERQRVSHKLQLCPEEYLPIVEGAIDGALRIHEQEKDHACV